MAIRRDQIAHERLIPILVAIIGAKSYLELGTHIGETILKVKCPIRIGVDDKHSIPWPWPAGLTIYGMTTQEFIRDTARFHAPYDFVFIDADHSEASVKADLVGIRPFVSDEGIICLHDTNPETKADTVPGLCGDAYKILPWLADNYEAVTLPYHPGLTIIRNRLHWIPA